jgi:hypothetical protein
MRDQKLVRKVSSFFEVPDRLKEFSFSSFLATALVRCCVNGYNIFEYQTV